MTTNPASPIAPSSTSRESAPALLQIHCNGEPRAVPVGTSIAALLAELQMSPRQVAVEVNLQLVPRTHHAEHLLADGDRLEIVSLVGGG